MYAPGGSWKLNLGFVKWDGMGWNGMEWKIWWTDGHWQKCLNELRLQYVCCYSCFWCMGLLGFCWFKKLTWAWIEHEYDMYMVCGYVVHGESRWAVLSYIVLPSLRLSVCLCVFYPFMLYGCLHSVSGLASESVVEIFCVCSFLWRHVVLSCPGDESLSNCLFWVLC